MPTFAPCFGFDLVHYILLLVPPPPSPVIRALLCLRVQQTSETVWTFPVELEPTTTWLNKRWQTWAGVAPAALHGNREKRITRVNHFKAVTAGSAWRVYICVGVHRAPCTSTGTTSELSSSSNDLCHVIARDARRALISCYFVSCRYTPLSFSSREREREREREKERERERERGRRETLSCRISSACFPQLLFSPWFCRFLRPPLQPGRSHFTVQSGILINWPVL